MLSVEEKMRYSRQTILPEMGEAAQLKLKAARVLVIGAGGLGCPVLQYLSAAGVGTLGIADGDVVSVSNLQRQILYTSADIGSPKAVIAARQIAALNPYIEVCIYQTFVTVTNLLTLAADYDIIVDGSDNFATRYLVNDAAVILGKPMVSGAIYKYEGQVSVFNYKGGPTYRCLFPQPPGEGESPNCAEIGVVATLPGIIGTIQANEVIKIITGIGDVLSGRLLVMDTLSMTTHFFNFAANPTNKLITTLSQPEAVQCVVAPVQVSYNELKELLATQLTLQLVDVREAEEHQISNIGGVNMPLSEIAGSMGILQKDKPVAVYCASGVRSIRAAKLLLQQGFSQVINLQEGVRDLGL
jgi:molybdopterin/thiamine biosynthesis adenylyltransferase/rhodanese-related sulfurtransferase